MAAIAGGLRVRARTAERLRRVAVAASSSSSVRRAETMCGSGMEHVAGKAAEGKDFLFAQAQGGTFCLLRKWCSEVGSTKDACFVS